MATSYYEDLLEKTLMDESRMSVLHVRPSKTLAEEQRQAEAERLRRIRDSWTPEELQRTLDLNRELARWQQTPDTPEQLATLPRLTRSELSADIRPSTLRAERIGEALVLRHSLQTNGIVHLSLYFRMTDLTEEELFDLSLLTMLLSELPTRNSSVNSLQRRMKRYTGRFGANATVLRRVDELGLAAPCLRFNCSALEENLDEAVDLMAEIQTETDLTQADKVREILLQEDDLARHTLTQSGDSYALSRANAHYSAPAAVSEYLHGIENVRALHALTEDFDSLYPAHLERMQRMLREGLCRSRLVLSVNAVHLEKVDAEAIAKRFPAGTPVPEYRHYRLDAPVKEGIRVPSAVNYVAMAGRPANAAARRRWCWPA